MFARVFRWTLEGRRPAMLGAIVVLLGLAGAVSATNYSLWINGRNNTSAVAGNYADFIYWGPSSAAAGVNKKAVNWDGYNRISTQNYRIRDALDCYCTGNNWCYIAAHSAGNLQTGYAFSLYGGSTRNVKNATPTTSRATKTSRSDCK